MKRNIGHGLWIAVFVVFLLQAPVNACTLWAASGERVAGGGTLIHKNRDWAPDHQQELRLMTPKKGFRYISLYATGNEWPGTKAGVNTEGLVIVTASAPKYLETKERFQGKTNTATLLSRYGAVDQALKALAAGEWKCGPEFILVADPNEVASIEFGPEGQYALLSRESNGSVYHTNHYISETLAGLNPDPINKSSSLRYQRIAHLMQQTPVLSTDTSQAFSKDPALWRKGASPTAARTLAGWTIRQTTSGGALLYLTLANPDREEKSYEIPLADAFAGKYDLTNVR